MPPSPHPRSLTRAHSDGMSARVYKLHTAPRLIWRASQRLIRARDWRAGLPGSRYPTIRLIMTRVLFMARRGELRAVRCTQPPLPLGRVIHALYAHADTRAAAAAAAANHWRRANQSNVWAGRGVAGGAARDPPARLHDPGSCARRARRCTSAPRARPLRSLLIEL